MYDGDDVAVIAVEFALLMIGQYLQLSYCFYLDYVALDTMLVQI